MITTYPESSFASRPFTLKAALTEPLLIVGVSAFWLVTLPFAAVAMVGVKIVEGMQGFVRGSARTNPLILRTGSVPQMETGLARHAAHKKA